MQAATPIVRQLLYKATQTSASKRTNFFEDFMPSGKRSFIIIVAVLLAAVAIVFAVTRKSVSSEPPAVTSASMMPDLKPRVTTNPQSLAEYATAVRTLEHLRKMIKDHPEQIDNYAILAGLYFEEARATGDHHYYVPIADRLVNASLAMDSTNYASLLVKSSILMTKHQFISARDLATRTLKVNPDAASIYGVLCDANVELGQYTAAAAACDKMLGIKPNLHSYARASYIREIYGDEIGAARAMKMAADAGLYGREDREWALYNLANLYANEGKFDTAKFLYNGILEERPDYAYAMSGLADVKMKEGDISDAIKLYVQATQSSPEHVFLEKLSSAYLASGDTAGAKLLEARVLNAFKLHEQQGWNVDQEFAEYALEHQIPLPEAMKRAKRNYEMRPNNIQAAEIYAWALYRTGDFAAASKILPAALRTNSKNSRLAYRAAAIESASGDKQGAITRLKNLLKKTSFIDVLSTSEAHKLRDLLTEKAG